MSQEHEDAPSIRRGLGGVLMLAVPIVSIAIVGTAYLILLSYGLEGRDAAGELTTVTYDGCPEAAPVLTARLEAMGLPDLSVDASTDGVLSVTARLPADERTASAIPRDLTRPGTFAILPDDPESGDAPLATRADLASAQISLAFFDVPKTTIQLKPEAADRVRSYMETHPEDGVRIFVDGEQISRRQSMPPEARGLFTLDRVGRSDLERLEFAASTAIVIEHGPLPCELKLRAQAP